MIRMAFALVYKYTNTIGDSELSQLCPIADPLIGYGQYDTSVLPVQPGHQAFREKGTYFFGGKVQHTDHLLSQLMYFMDAC